MAPRSLAAAAALVAMALPQGAAAAAGPCIPQRDAEALVVVAAPSLIASVAVICTPALPATAYLRRSASRVSAKFAADGDAAWPVARRALGRLVGADAGAMLDSEFARPILAAAAGPLLAQNVKPADCATIDRVLALVDPLPARNAAALVVTVAQIATRGRTIAGLSICPPTASAP